MRRGRPSKPIISIESVNAALKLLDFSVQTLPESQALENLLLIDFRLQNAARPSAEDIRGWMLRKILVEWMTNALNQHRQYFNLHAASLNSSREIALRQLEQDFRTESEHLKGWSLLYIRYVRPELNVSVQELAERTHTTNRTLQRYQEKTVYNLRDLFIEAEWTIRNSQQKLALKSIIPEQIVPLVGRDSEFKSILSHFHEDFPHPVFISGVYGVGKSALAATVANDLIEHSTIDYHLWMKQPQQVSFIANKIWDTVLPYPTQQHWREVLEHQRLLLVIDGVDSLDMQSDDWAELLLHLQQAFVIIIGTKKPILKQPVYHIELENLSQADSLKLIGTYSENDISFNQQIISMTDGNPRNLIHAMQIPQTTTNHSHGYYDAIHSTLSEREEIIQIFVAINGEQVADELIERVLQDAAQHFIIKANSLPTLSNAYETYLQNLYETNENLQHLAHQMIPVIASSGNNASFLLKIIACEWLQLNKALIQMLLEMINLNALSLGDVHQWRYLYQRHFGLDSDFDEQQHALNYQYGIALRRSHMPQAAEAHLEVLTQILGEKGEFELQLQTLYQLGLLYQAQGQFMQAQEIYSHIRRLLHTYTIPDLTRDIPIQLARIAIAQQNAELALEHLEGFDLNVRHVFVLFCEAHFLLEDWQFLFSRIPAYLKQQGISNKIRSSLHTILARAYQENAQYTEAIIHFNEALSNAEREENPFDIGRARNNLANIYLMNLNAQSQEFLAEIEAILVETRQLQSQIKDAVGLEATTRNLTYLKHHQASMGG